ncbi:PhzF family phenazine biosynthesis protein [Ramlibacter sp. AW1]|uniref:PhzF family phenazine biosynthesis protein n=1 Tax=Ramlibacter aurantiacus TaxID=2801330 RepID=A0A936ZMI8_9BURK|nr:PhzF family phenazine biosynthesis protein [Ramlibacter aurantiacus]MBL0420033.1 PhzF family phenazine biosynthesis protein [Ramlibacter aurantiacus]
MNRSFKQVDVFTRVPFAGNPVAVVLDASGLDASQMQRIANWTNLSETTFVLPPTQPGADYRVRIFTPRAELPFAGHPTLGTAHALLEAGTIVPRDGQLVQECGAGLIALTVSSVDGARQLAFELPTARHELLQPTQVEELASILGTALRDPHPPRRIEVGPIWTVVQLASAEAVLALRPDLARLAELDGRTGSAGVVVFGAQAPGADAAIEVRAFAPAQGIAEDPVCGSGNGAVAAFIRDTGQTGTFGSRFTSAQGVAVGRDGRIALSCDMASGRILVGGCCVSCIEGVVRC